MTTVPLGFLDHSAPRLPEVRTDSGIVVIAAAGSCIRTNAKTSRIDLADLSEFSPRWKSAFSPRVRVNFGVTFDLSRIVVFSKIDRSNVYLK